VFGCSILGAAVAASASQTQGTTRTVLATIGALSLAWVSFLTARRLGEDRALAWVRARGAAEALKREAHLYCSGASPYDVAATRDELLAANVAQVETGVDDLIGQQVEGPAGSTPLEPMPPADYLARRVQQQAEAYYAPRAEAARRTAAGWRDVEFGLAFVTMVITTVLGVIPKEMVAGVPFDFIALVSVLTTISGAIVSHVEASRFDFQVISYRVAARRLRELLANAPVDPAVPSTAWSVFVAQCESVIAEQNGTWSAKFGKPQPEAVAAAGAAAGPAVAGATEDAGAGTGTGADPAPAAAAPNVNGASAQVPSTAVPAVPAN
jgi:hypothetical protein